MGLVAWIALVERAGTTTIVAIAGGSSASCGSGNLGRRLVYTLAFRGIRAIEIREWLRAVRKPIFAWARRLRGCRIAIWASGAVTIRIIAWASRYWWSRLLIRWWATWCDGCWRGFSWYSRWASRRAAGGLSRECGTIVCARACLITRLRGIERIKEVFGCLANDK